MTKELTTEQEIAISELVLSDERTDADVTIGDRIRERLGLTSEQYDERSDAIEELIVALFEGLADPVALEVFREGAGEPVLSPAGLLKTQV